MSEINISVLKCPVCGNPLTNFDGRSSVVQCQDCKNIVAVSGDIISNIDVPERIVPFVNEIENFENFIEELFIKEDYMPRDIFELVSFDDVRPIYLPMFLYEGRFVADWDCELAREETYVGTNSDGTKVQEKTRTVYYPHSGTTRNDFNILALAYEGEELPSELAAFARTFSYEASMSKAYNPSFFTERENLIVLPHNQDKENIWVGYAMGAIDNLAKRSVKNHLSAKKYKNLNMTVMYDGQTSYRLAYIPFWFVYFDYQGAQYYVLMDGLGNNTSHTTPKDPVTVAETEKLASQTTYIIGGAILLAIGLFFINFIPSTVYWIIVGLLAAASVTMAVINENKKTKIIEEVREIRREGLKNIQG